MGQNNLYERLYGQPLPDPKEDQKVEPCLKSRSGRSFLESLRNEERLGDSCQPDASGESA